MKSRVFEGMEGDVIAQAESAAAVSGEALTAELLRPVGDISRRAGKMEREAPLFFGSGENPGLW